MAVTGSVTCSRARGDAALNHVGPLNIHLVIQADSEGSPQLCVQYRMTEVSITLDGASSNDHPGGMMASQFQKLSAEEPKRSEAQSTSEAFQPSWMFDTLDQDGDELGVHDHQARLASVRQRSRELRQNLERHPSQGSSKQILATARSMLDTFTQLALDDEFWSALTLEAFKAEDYFNELKIDEILHSDLAGLLDLLEYAPPPSSLELAADVVEALDATHEPGHVAAEKVLDARYRLCLYNYRLRRLILPLETKKKPSGSERRTLLESLRRGALAAAPGMVVAGIKGVIWPPAGVAQAGQAVLHGIDEATKEAVGSVVAIGAGAVIGRYLAEEESQTDPNSQFKASVTQFVFLANELSTRLETWDGDKAYEQKEQLQALTIQVVRSAYQLLRASAATRDFTRHTEPAMFDAIDQLNLLQDWLQLAYPPEWQALAETVGTSLRAVRDRTVYLKECYVIT